MRDVTAEGITELVNAVFEGAKIDGSDIDQEIAMDSIQFMRFIIAIESEYEIEVTDKYLIVSEMNTIRKVVDAIDSVRSSQVRG